MAYQSPLISIPKKGTEEVDWTTPIRTAIGQSYGEDPDNYASECAALQRCRQDAVRGAGSDTTARDLLYKYFGQLELLELRFPEIRVNFPWRDAFTAKLIVQTSLAYEKASIIFQIAATHAAIAASQSRSDPEGLKRAFYYLKCSAGMLTYINENFLHAPSTDLSREVIKFLVGIILAQATEVFWEKCRDEKKGNALMSKIASQASTMYNGLTEEVKEFMGKGIFDRNWVTVIQSKAKHFTSIMHYYRGLADAAAGKHGDALVRFNLAESLAKEANRTASSFASIFLPPMSPNLPPDAGTTLLDLTKAHLALCTERRAEAQRENDMIYNAVLPAPETLPAVDKLVVAEAIPIQEVYGTPEVQKVIGSDLFIRLIPLSVHESASVYSEEKAKLVRGEVEKAEEVAAEMRSVLDSLGVKAGLGRFKAMVEGGVAGEDEIPPDVRRFREDIALIEERESVDVLMERLTKMRQDVQKELESVERELEIESKDCEAMRVKYDHLFTQAPSAGFTKSLRADLKSHWQAWTAAGASDEQVRALWSEVVMDIGLLLSEEQVEAVFKDSVKAGHNRRESLLDLDMERDDEERQKIAQFVDEIDERLGRLNKIEREREQTLKDLKDKIQADDVSHLLLLNRRNPNVEPTLFATELEKFRPYQQRLGQSVHQQQLALQEVTTLWKGLKDLAGRGDGARKWDERERRKKEAVRRFSRARDGYMEVRDGLAKGLQFYSELSSLSSALQRNVREFVTSRNRERENIASQAATQQRLSSPSTPVSPPPKPPLPPSARSGLESSFASLNMNGTPTRGGAPALPPPPPPPSWSTATPPPQSAYASTPPPPHNYSAPAPSQSQQQRSSMYGGGLPPPPPLPAQSPHSYSSSPPPTHDPYASLGSLSSFATAPSNASSPYSAPRPPPPQQPVRQGSYPPPPTAQSPYQQQQSYQQLPTRQGGGMLPPPPPPVNYQSQQPQYGGTPQPPQQYQQGGYQNQGQYATPPPPPPQQQQQYQGYWK